jgi:ornithine--oxo-acid transaminase
MSSDFCRETVDMFTPIEGLTRNVRILGSACALGGPEAGCADGPDELVRLARNDLSRLDWPHISWGPVLRPRATKGEPLSLIAELCERLARHTYASVRQGEIPVVLGGDHSCAVGTWSGVARALEPRGPLGLIWIDAHMDSHTPQTSPSGLAHGMPLAALLGFGDARLTECMGSAPRVIAPHVCVIGVHEFEPEEARLLRQLGAHLFSMEDVRRRGLPAILDEALAIVRRGTAGFGITIDVDAVDPREAPGVSVPAEGGLHADELLSAVARLRGDPQLVGAEIAEFNPRRDQDGVTGKLAWKLLTAMLGSGASEAQRRIEAEKRFSAPNYDTLPVVLARGEGAWLWDIEGRRYLDMMSAYSAVSHGHAHPRLLRALDQQARRLAVTSRVFHNDRLPLLLARLCELTGQDRALPVNTGLEAVETALKAARRWAYQVKRVPPEHAEIIACEGNFHGRSLAIIGMSSEPSYRRGFGPFPPGFRLVPYGDAAALAQAITPHTAAFIVEPVQGESGIIIPPRGYLAECARICRERGVLLIADEVQTGLGRTGKFLACEHEGVKPDGLILGKALGGGLLPVSAFLAREDVMQVFEPGAHGSTFGGNPLGAAVALEALALLFDERLIERSAELGGYLLEQLRTVRSPLIHELRGIGLFIGLELSPGGISAREVCLRLLAHGVLTKDTHESVLRFAPPLVVTHEQLDWALARIREVFAELRSGRRAAA